MRTYNPTLIKYFQCYRNQFTCQNVKKVKTLVFIQLGDIEGSYEVISGDPWLQLRNNKFFNVVEVKRFSISN